MPAKIPIQHPIRGVPKEVDGSGQYRSLKGLAGCWKEDPEFDRAIEEQRRIDRKLFCKIPKKASR
jgi:hypothetical protein